MRNFAKRMLACSMMLGAIVLFVCSQVTWTTSVSGAGTGSSISAACTSGNILQDSSFEASTGDPLQSPNWAATSTSTDFPTPLCDDTVCGENDSRTGNVWVWFGGLDTAVTDSVSQSFTIPSGATATLHYYLWIADVTAPFTDTLVVKVDSTVVQTFTEPTTAEANYSLRSVNLGAYADGVTHTVTFQHTTPSGGGVANFFMDDVTLDIVCPAATPPPSHLGNISTRGFVGTGDDVMIGGLIINGTDPKTVLVRAIGPSLAQFGLNAVSDPTLELHDGSNALIAKNDNWQTTQIFGVITSDQVAQIQNSLPPSDSRESVIIATLQPGNYTAIVRGVNNTTGVALVEAYDLSPNSNSKLGNISTRGFIGTGDNVMIGGFIINGSQPKKVMVLARGPELASFGLTTVADPTLELHDGTGALIGTNNNWQTTQRSSAACTDEVTDIQNSGLAPSQTVDSAILTTLAPGNYTAIVRGVSGGTGIGIVEVYDLGDSPLQITNVSNTTPGPLTAISLSTTGVVPTDPVTVTFCNNAGFYTHEAPIRVDASGTLTVGVPMYVNPSSNQVGPGTVSVSISQGANKSAPVSIQVQDLPPLSAYGTQLGEITQAFLTYEGLLLGHRMDFLQSAHLLQNSLNTSAAQSHSNTLLVGAVKSSADVQTVMNNNNATISWGNLPDGTHVQFDKNQLEMMDRILGVYLTQQFAGFTPPITQNAARASQISSPQPSSVVTSLLDSMTSRDGVPAVISYVQGSGSPGDAGMALLNPLANAYTDNPGFPGAVGVVMGLTHLNTAVNTTLNDVITAVGCNGDSSCVNDAVSRIQTEALAIPAAVAEAIAHIPLVLGVENNAEQALSGTLGYMSNFAGFANSGATDADNQTAVAAATSPIIGNTAEMEGTANAATGQSSLNLCCFGSASLGIKGTTDPNGDYAMMAPVGVANTNYGNMTFSVGDIVSGNTLDSDVVDLTDLDPSQPIQIQPPPNLGNYDGSYSGSFSGAATCTAPDGTVVSNPVPTTSINFSVSNGAVTISGGSGTVSAGGAISFTYPISGNPVTYQGTITADGHINNGSWAVAGLPAGCSEGGGWSAARQ